MLACYFKADFETLYRNHAGHWEPPVYGLCADDWPVPGVDQATVKPRLRLLLSTTV